MLKIEYLYAGSLFMLNTIWVYGIGMMLEMFLGFGFIRFLPIGICMFAAYRYKSSIGPKVDRFFISSGFNAFPLYPFKFLEYIPFLNPPV
jgi:hypothetical protein